MQLLDGHFKKMKKEKIELIVSYLHKAYSNYINSEYKKKILLAKKLLQAGFVENILNNSFIKNIINLLAPFVQNKKIKQAISLLQEGLQDETKQKEKEKKQKQKQKRIKGIKLYFDNEKNKWVVDTGSSIKSFWYEVNARNYIEEIEKGDIE